MNERYYSTATNGRKQSYHFSQAQYVPAASAADAVRAMLQIDRRRGGADR